MTCLPPVPAPPPLGLRPPLEERAAADGGAGASGAGEPGDAGVPEGTIERSSDGWDSACIGILLPPGVPAPGLVVGVPFPRQEGASRRGQRISPYPNKYRPHVK